jgi:F-type H+-transporting ATPase subunit alpha
LLRDVPVEKVTDFEKEFLEKMEVEYSETLKTLREGKLTDEVTQSIEQAAKEVARNYSQH